MSALTFSSIDQIVDDIAGGKLVIVADDPARENEADLIGAASRTTPETIAFMATHGRGLICAPVTRARVEALNLPPMSRRNREGHRTAFTVSVDAADGITTGISAADRSRTIGLLANEDAGADSLVQPGHVFPLQAADDGVLRRAGHTEAAVDLALMANLPGVGMLCEIMHEDGTMARVGDLGDYQQTHGLKACTIAQIIEYRRRTERLVACEETIDLPTEYGAFDCHLYREHTDDSHHLALTRGQIDPEQPTLVRVHSECLTGDVFSS
ncbi:MAG: 3,4-dihydroxy-2-butanone-4-phosphate synthase, partial [Verrucomicrobiota bacterium]|nr:3,4-dihydroxy-2-butanone-4-phosphate synthase [Verrucomicrobiota bacterium]